MPVEIRENRVGQATPGSDGKVSPEASPTVTPTVLPDPPVGSREVDPPLEVAEQDEADPTNDDGVRQGQCRMVGKV